MEYRERIYRNDVSTDDLITFQVSVKETDLFISAYRDLTDVARQSIYRYRRFIEAYIESHPGFMTSLKPMEIDCLAPSIVKEMLEMSYLAGVGPMAAVAGAIAQYVGADLLKISSGLIIENGGDIYMKSDKEVLVGVFAGESPLSHKVALRVRPEKMPLGICTSSGTVGPSLSFGAADAVCVIAKSAVLADAAATSIGNLVRNKRDIKKGLQRSTQIQGVLGAVVIVGDQMGAIGDVELG